MSVGQQVPEDSEEAVTTHSYPPTLTVGSEPNWDPVMERVVGPEPVTGVTETSGAELLE